MKKFIIDIKYSWGDEEKPIEVQTTEKWEAFEHMCNLALNELHTIMLEYPEYVDNTVMKVFENKIILHYGYDDEECYYELREESR